jgi:histone deacetylase 1/2
MAKCTFYLLKSSFSHAQELLELVHTDVWGPSPINSNYGFKYYVHFIDDCSRFTWIFPLKHKSETVHAFTQFKTMAENLLNKKIKIIQCDGGGEFKPVQKCALEAGIQFRMSCPYTSQQNGRAERKHRHIAELGLTLLAQANMPLSFWWEAFSTAVYLINRLPSTINQIECPYTVLYKKEPDYSALKPFGCACYPCLRPFNKHKLQFHTTRCVFIGYSNSHKGYKCLNSHGKTFISRHVVFNENHFPFHDGFLNTRKPLQELTEIPSSCFPLFPAGSSGSDHEAPPLNATQIERNNNPLSTAEDNSTANEAPTDQTLEENITTTERNGGTDSVETRAEPGSIPAGNETSSNQIWTRSKAGIHKPKLPYIGVTETTLEEIEPRNTKEALARPQWKTAMESEFQALISNHTWTLVPYTGQENIIDSKWVFKTKYKADGSIERRKARLVAKGFQQTAGLDYEETFSPVVKASTVRIILSIAVHLNWDIRQLDINNAFLNGHLKETVFMHQPEGFSDPAKPHHICKLSKAIYGLKQAPRAWFDKLRTALLNWGFQNTKSDSSLFFLRGADHTTFLLIYVDDIIITGSSNKFLEAFIKQLNIVFSLKDLGQLHYFLGIEVQRDASGLYMKQSKYIKDLLRKFKMENVTACPTPMVTGRQFTIEGEPMTDPTLFRQAMGALQYLINTRPDIAFSVNKLSQYMCSPTLEHWQGIKRIFRYLKGTIDHCLHIKPSTDLDITGYSDADWATSIDDRKSVAGQCVFLGETLVLWSSRKQKVVSRSSTESEYRALADLAAEITWVSSLLQELKLPQLRKPVLWCDNLSAKALASNPVMHARSKHIEIDVHYIRDKVLQNEITIAYVPSADQIADCLTKALTHSRFNQLRDKLGVITSPTSLRGSVREQDP